MFTNKDLKQLNGRLNRLFGLGVHSHTMSLKRFTSLLARLEAAERVVHGAVTWMEDWVCPCCGREGKTHADDCDIDIALTAWRKECGKS